MQNQIFYIDHNATTPVDPRVIQKIAEALNTFSANPSSTHTLGRKVRAELELAREEISKSIGAPAREIVFTSGGTEADNLALLGHSYEKGDLVISSEVEHPAIDQALESLIETGVEVQFVKLNSSGLLDLNHLKELLLLKPKVVSLIWGHNETGVIQDIPQVARLICDLGLEKEIFFHTDAVQTLGRFDACQILPGLSAMSLSSHKVNGPKGVGALWVRGGREIVQRQLGGSQEREMRPGTENVPGILGFAEALRIERTEGESRRALYSSIRDDFESKLQEALPGVYIHGQSEERLVNTSCVSFPGLEADILLLGLDMAGIQVSAGSACAAGAVKSSRVIRNLGFEEAYARATIRFSFGLGNQLEDNSIIVEKIVNLVNLGGGLKVK